MFGRFLFFFLFLTLYVFGLDRKFLEEASQKLRTIHSQVHLMYGSFSDEYPEQLMTTMYLHPDAKVLELGGNIGRNSCVIASILNDSRNLVSLESSKGIAENLTVNRDKNGFLFHIEPSALSKVPLVQNYWTTIPSEVDLPGYGRVDTITFEELRNKYRIDFDTLIADCEGALYYILRDEPNLLQSIKLIIVENDYSNRDQQHFVEKQYLKNGFSLVYSQSFNGVADFYQVWKK